MSGAEIEIADFRGDAQAASDFMNMCWSAQFPDDFTCPQWDAPYFQWLMFSRPDHIRLGAYADGQLVGFVFGEPTRLKWFGEPIAAMFSTALGADPKRKGQGIAKKLASELAVRLRAQNLAFVFGFAVPGTASLGPKFWQGAQGAPRGAGIRPWVRPLSASTIGRAAGPRGERLSARIGAAFGFDGSPRQRHPAVRAYKADDLDACLEMIATAEADADMRLDWTAERLALQLDYKDIPKTLVYDDGAVRGFINHHRVWFRGRERFSGGMIDHLIAQDGRADVQSALLASALWQMGEGGEAMAICPSSACAKKRVLLRHRFTPLPNAYDCLFPFVQPQYDTSQLKTVKVHLR